MQQDYGSVTQIIDERNGLASTSGNKSSNNELHRHLTLFDLVCVGVGATVGSGVFVLIGLIAHTQAGPAVSLSWFIAGIAACCSGLCYAELGGRFPSAGSSYVYARETMGECAAVCAGACLTLEYTGSASAVARSWGDKVVTYAKTYESPNAWYQYLIFILDPGFGINPCAFVVSSGAVILLLRGVKESKSVTNFFSTLNVSLVFFMATFSLILVKKENMIPYVPKEFGTGGVLRGATSSFFGYIGFDEICCMSGEAISPSKNIPRAIIITLIVVTTLYCAASIGLAGMVPYQDISEKSGFPDGFRYRGYSLVAEITALGELIVLPLVVLVTIMAQPRLNYTMAVDGVIPILFAGVNEEGNLGNKGIKICGIIMIAIATMIPFTYLDDLISSGILIAFTITDTSVILVRLSSPHDNPGMLEKLLVLFHSLSFLSGILLRNCSSTETTGDGVRMMTVLFCACTLFTGYRISLCPLRHELQPNSSADFFLTPYIPTLPLLGCFVNIYLISQLEVTGLFRIFGYLGIALLVYYLYQRGQSSQIIPPERMLSLKKSQR